MSCMARELCGNGGSDDKARASTVISSSSSGFGYSDHLSPTPGSPVQHPQLVAASAVMCSSYDSGSEIFNLASGINLIGFPKNNPHHISGLGHRDDDASTVAWTHHHHHQQHNDLMAPPPLMVDSDGAGDGDDGEDHSLRCAVFPCERNERPSQGLSLSLSSTNPSGIGLQSFELRHADGPSNQNQGAQFDDPRGDLFYGKSIQPQQFSAGQFTLRYSKYIVAAQELLNEFCSLGSNDFDAKRPNVQKGDKGLEEEKRNGSSSSSTSKQEQSLQLLELAELQRRKAKLLAMLEEVDRQYRHYCNQMKAVVTSFEAVAGVGSATVYSAFASKAMSRHFRCLRDGIVGQIQSTSKAMGEKDTAAPGTTKGETPRLRIIDQALRQQRAFQQMTMMENHPWRPQRGLPERSVSVLRAWLFEHFLHPYPSDVDKHILARQTGLSRSQVSNWFINARVRLWKPMVEEMYMEETKEHDNLMDGMVSATDTDQNGRPSNPNTLLLPRIEDQKPSSDQLIRIDSECLSSIISGPDPKGDVHLHHNLSRMGIRNPNSAHHHLMQQQPPNQWMELDLASYNHNAAVTYENMGTSFGGGGVSLTLGLQQHRGDHHQGVSLAFSPTAAVQGSLFYPGEHMEDCHPVVQYSILDGEGQSLPYRNLMGPQLLRDLAG